MQSLLRWGIENSEPGTAQPSAERKELDPGVIDMILGKPDAELMKEALTIAVDEKRSEDDRLEALDNFEMLVESIDNANDLVKLKMWEPIHALLTAAGSTDDIKMQTLWIIGTAVQNNPAAQQSYLALSPVGTLLSFLSPETRSAKTRSKAVYALSSLLKHCAPAVRQLEEVDGWEAFKGALQDPDITVRRKTAFLLNALLIPTSPVSAAASAIPQNTQSSTSENSVIVHPDPTVHNPESSAHVVHPNSHASMIADPTSFSTSDYVRRAMAEKGLLQALIDALVSPTPHGLDGEKEGDAEFEDKIISVVHTYIMSCHGRLSSSQKAAISGHLSANIASEGGEHALAERWGLSSDEVRLFKRALEEQ